MNFRKMSRVIGTVFTCGVLAVLSANPARLLAQGNARSQTSQMVTFDAPHAGNAAGEGTFPQDNNTAGAITGFYVDENVVYHGFLRAPDGTMTVFDPPGSGNLKGSSQGTAPQAINNHGAIAGQFQDENYVYHGFLLTPDGTYTVIDAPGAGTQANLGTWGEDINSTGIVAGYYEDANQIYHGFVREKDGTITTFDAPGAGMIPNAPPQGTVVTFEQGINSSGAIIGWYFDSNYVQHGYVRSPDGTFTTIDGPDAIATGVGGITPNGTITGTYVDDTNFVAHGFVWADGNITTFEDPEAAPNYGTNALTINPEGTVTGVYFDANMMWHGFRRTAAGVFTTIDVAGASLNRPETINSRGAITGYYLSKTGVAHGFLWTP